jgi:hypothetical protein
MQRDALEPFCFSPAFVMSRNEESCRAAAVKATQFTQLKQMEASMMWCFFC